MSIAFDDVKRLNELTGVGVTEAKKALEAANGDLDKATETMRKQGLMKAEKKGGREARAGLVDSYVHSSRIGVVVEVNCETDFVARTDEFKDFVHDVAMQIAASAPTYVSADDVPKAELTKEEEIEREALKQAGKPTDKADAIIKGRLDKYLDGACLMRQPFIKNPDQTIEEYTKETIAKLGENIVVRRFKRLELGEKE